MIRELVFNAQKAPQHNTTHNNIQYHGVQFYLNNTPIQSNNKLCTLGVKVFFNKDEVPITTTIKCYITESPKRPKIDGVKMRRFKKVKQGEKLKFELIDGRPTMIEFNPQEHNTLLEWLGEEGLCYFGVQTIE